MWEIAIRLPEKPEKVGSLARGAYRIGKSPAAHIQINLPEVSNRHAVLIVKDNQVTIEDAGSTNGTFLDGARIGKEPVEVKHGSVIRIGTAKLEIRRPGESHHELPDDAEPAEEKPAGTAANAPPPPINRAARKPDKAAQVLMISGIRYEYRKIVQQIKRRVHDELITRMNLKNLTLSGAEQQEIEEQARETINRILNEMSNEIPRQVDRDILEQELVDEAVGLGAVQRLLADPEITEIMVNGADQVYVEKRGVLFRTDLTFADDTQVLTVIERIVAPLGRRIDESQPLVDARLADGSRVNAIIPPLAIDGPTLTIRKFSKDPLTMDTLVDTMDSLSRAMATFLRTAVLVRKNILISGGTGSGKTTLLNAVSNFLPNTERIVTIEDAAELRLQKDHIVRLESRPPNIEGRGAIPIRELVRNSLRMRPDRIVVGECRGGEALDMLQAMNTGHDGSLTTIHSNSPRDALSRLETLVLMAGFDLPLRAIREQIASAVDLIVHISRMRDGSRRIVKITEITGMEGEVITSQDLFVFEQTGIDGEGRVLGTYKPTGVVPTFMDEIQAAGLPFDISIFREGID